MKLSLASSSLKPYLQRGDDPRYLFRLYRETGFRCLDFHMSPFRMEDLLSHAEEWRDLFSDLGLDVQMTHAHMVNPFEREENYAIARDRMIQALRFCQKAGFPNTVIHPGARNGNTREEFFENNVKFYRELLPYVEETGVVMLIENIGHYMDPYFLWSGKDLREMIDAVDHPLVGACYDIGHANHFEYIHGGDHYASLLALGEKLTAIHAHDNVGFFADTKTAKRVDMHVAPYSCAHNSVNWDAVLQGLKDIGYQGVFNFEVIVPAPSRRCPEFIHDGEPVRKLELLPPELWRSANRTLFEIGKYMLESYGLYED